MVLGKKYKLMNKNAELKLPRAKSQHRCWVRGCVWRHKHRCWVRGCVWRHIFLVLWTFQLREKGLWLTL